MSFEGYYQFLCEVGHLQTRDAYAEKPKQCSCGKPVVWRNLVDDTNYDQAGKIELEVAQPWVAQECECCGYMRTIARPRYVIPKDGDRKDSST